MEKKLSGAALHHDKPIRLIDISPTGQMRLLNMAYARIAFGLAMIPVVATPFVAWLYQIKQSACAFLVWAALFSMIAVFVHFQFRRYRQDCSQLTEERVISKWLPRVHALAITYGLSLSTPIVIMSVDTFPFEFAILFLVTSASIMAGNATHQSPVLSAFQRFFAAGWGMSTLLIPWVFPDHWPYVMPLTALFILTIYKHAVVVHRFFLQQILLEEDSVRLAENYRLAKNEAEAALRAKNQFLTTASHDLRQPVQAMGFLIESIARRNQDQSLMPALLDLKQSVRSVTQMFNSLLDLSKIESGTMSVTLEPVRLDELAWDVATLFREEAKSRRLELRVRLSGDNAVVRADATLLRQSMINLMQNALRYTKHGGVLMATRRRGKDWRFEVWDTGMGIALEDREHIHSPFFRNEHAWHIDSAGHGLGLAVVSRCVALMQATHGFDSRVGRGSWFWIQLTAAEWSPTTHVALAAENTNVPSGKFTLRGNCLIVDDDPQVCAAWESLLVSWGLQVRCTDSATEAFQTISDGFQPQAIFCDQRLRAGESGFEVLRELLESCPQACGAMISGEFDSPQLRQAEQEGYLVLRKPLEPSELHAVLCRWLPEAGNGELG